MSALNVMAIHAQRHTNVSKQINILTGVYAGAPLRRVCGRGLNRYVHEVCKGSFKDSQWKCKYNFISLQKMDLNKDGVISLEEFMDTCRMVSCLWTFV